MFMFMKEKSTRTEEVIMSVWVEKWEVEGSNGKTWVVSVDVNGNYGCSCPVWKFKREECKHIRKVLSGCIAPMNGVREIEASEEKLKKARITLSKEEMKKLSEQMLTNQFDLGGMDPEQIMNLLNRVVEKTGKKLTPQPKQEETPKPRRKFDFSK